VEVTIRRGKAIAVAMVAIVIAFLIGSTGAAPTQTTGALELTTAPGALWLPPSEPREPAAVESWTRDESIAFSDTGQPAWTVPRDPDWTEDPYRSDAWLFRYHSLQWLQAVALSEQAAGQTSYDRTRFLLFDYIRENPRGRDAPSHRSWYDHAVAVRTDVIVWLYQEHLAGVLTPAERDRLSRSLRQHGRALRGYLDAEYFIGHNHNLFHAMSLYNLTAIFPKIDPSGEWRTRARARTSELMTEMVDVEEGVSTEQAAVYHSLALRLFADAHRLLQTWGDGLSAEELGTLAKMTRFGLLLTRADATLPAIGDTRYAQRQNLGIYRSALELVDDPVARYLLTEGSEGEPPPEFAAYPHTGWTIFRPRPDGSSDPALHLVMRSGPPPRLRSHGHIDHLGFTLFADGVPWLVDSGGPYRRDHPLREYFQSADAHNSVIVDGHDDALAFTPLTFGDEPGLSHARGTRQLGDGVVHDRAIVVIKPDTVVILDRVSGTSDDPEQATTLYHLAPGVRLTPVEGEAGGYVATSGDRKLSVWLDASEPIDVEFSASGEADGIRDARVTRAVGREERSPLLSVRHRVQADDWSIAVLQPGRHHAGALSARLAGDAVLVLQDDWQLEIPMDDQQAPTLRRP
jgi:Heparinase II/III-like protein/Heparinase II/III N-terminus